MRVDGEEAITIASFDEQAPGYQAAFRAFLDAYYQKEIQALHASLTSTRQTILQRQEQTDAQQQSFAYSLRICAQFLIDFNPSLATLLFRHPDQFLPLFHAALAQQVTTSQLPYVDHMMGLSTIPLKIRQKLKVRIEFLPPVNPLRKTTISTIRSNDVKQLIQVAGTVVRTGMIKMQETSREYQCCNARCHYRFLVKSDPEQGNILEIPRICPSEKSGKPCKSTQFEIVENSRMVSDHQVIKIQEQVSKLGVGSIPRSILVVLEDDLVDSVKAGDQVVVVGILIRCWKPCVKDVRCDLETIVKANSIRIKNASNAHVLVTEELKKEFTEFWKTHQHHPMRGRNEIIASICPKVYGLYIVKLGVALTVIGGCSHVDATGMKTRGEPHMLLIGDPGTGKSQFLRFTAELSPRSVLTTGIGTTSAGLTCTAVKDGSEWMLEAGALVLADRGVCCIDEFSSIRSNDRTSIHEAMEQQTLSVAKAGLVCKLNARTTIFAVTNPKGRYDPNVDVSVNTSIGSPLLSRFDLILVLLDRMNSNWDHAVSSFILKQSTRSGSSINDKTTHDADEEEDEEEDEDEKVRPSFDLLTASHSQQQEHQHQHQHQQESQASSASKLQQSQDLLWSIPKLQAYICYVKDRYQPQFCRNAMTILQRYYQLQRASDTRSAARTTIRLLESLTRLSQAHARLMCHDQVEVMDAVVAVFVMEVSKATDSCSSLLGGGLESVLHSDFAEDPTTEYALQEKMVLENLGLTEFATCQPLSQQSTLSQRDSVYTNGYSGDDGHHDNYYPESRQYKASQTQRNSTIRNVTPTKRWQTHDDSDYTAKKNRWNPPSTPSSSSQAHIPWSQRHQRTENSSQQEDGQWTQAGNNATSFSSQNKSSRFNFGKWSQQAEQHQSVTSKWRK